MEKAPMTANEFFPIYSAYQKSRVTEDAWQNRNNTLLRYFLKKYGKLQIDRVAAHHINHVYDSMESAGLAQNTIFSAYAAMSSFFTTAREMGYISHNPVSEAKSVRPGQ